MAAIDKSAAAAPRLALSQAAVRNAALFFLSVLAVYWLQPATPIRHLDFWLPTASLALTTIVWAATSSTLGSRWKPDRAFVLDGLIVAIVVILIALTRYVDPLCCVVTRSRPPDVILVLSALAAVAVLTLLAARLIGPRPVWTMALVIGLIVLFILLKSPPLTQALSASLRVVQNQSVEQASAFDVRWLGFSYIAFRLIHTLRDRAAGKLPNMSLREFATYVVFFPSLSAGPIDRAERFLKDLRAPFTFNLADTTEGARRLALGLFKKFVIADLLTLIALNAVNAEQARGGLWIWLLLYAYAFRIYFDFSGYTDIAIGIGRFFGIKLPENFKQPYFKSNLTQFWNSWHITLAQWFRTYYFNPLTRSLRTRNLSMTLIILIGQLTTMLLIGLWHEITLNFAIWGLWHGVGLFIHNRWAELTKARLVIGDEQVMLRRAVNVAGVLLTFHFVALGWVWFALPSVPLSLGVFRKLFGLP